MIRAAGPTDAAAIAALHASSWRSAYRGVLPDSYLDHEVDSERLAHWHARLAALAPGDVVLLDPGRGFAAAFAAPDGDALLDALHVAPNLRGGGIGARLLHRVAHDLAQAGSTRMHLWVFEANRAARRFYARHGGTEGGLRSEFIAGVPVAEVRVGWDSLAALAAQPGR